MSSPAVIKRMGTSPYFSPSFLSEEETALLPLGEYLPIDSANSKATILITNTHTLLEDLSSSQKEHVKLIIHPNSGYDNFPSAFVESLKAPIVIGNAIRAQAVAHYILSALFHHFSNLPKKNQWDVERKWPRKLLTDAKIALIGFGHVGKILHQALSPLTGELTVHDPYQNYLHPTAHHGADVVILACGLNSKNRHLIDKSFLHSLPDDVLIINAARGGLIHTKDLIEFMSSHPRARAVLDVFEKEPFDFSLLVGNIIATSHIAGVYTGIEKATIDFEFQTIKDFLSLSPSDFNHKYAAAILQNKLRAGIGLI